MPSRARIQWLTWRAMMVWAWCGCTFWAAPVESDPRDFTVPSRHRPSPIDEFTASGGPTTGGIEFLTARARAHVVRISLASYRAEVRGARFDSAGVAYDGDPIHVVRPGGGPGAPVAAPSRAAIPWREIRALETRHSHVALGIVLGTVLGFIAAAVVADAAGSDPGPGIAVVAVFPPVGALAGGLIGARIPRWRHEWPPEEAGAP